MSIWGDGFADDSWHALMGVQGWGDVCRDECVRLFPRLVDEAGAIPDMVVVALDEAIERASAIERAGRPVSFPRLALPLRAVLVAIRDQARSGATELPSPAASAAFAFGTALHPAYFWPSEALAAERGTFLAWLGILNRGRPALMPIEVADYLRDVVIWTGCQPSALRDAFVAPFVDVDASLADLAAAARRTLAGESALVRPRRPGWSFSRLATSLTRLRAYRAGGGAFAPASEGEVC